ncbi:hypothetical protein M501DRAFT_381484 [Patellaria atrata CBS 101060]|uniref:Uncharacterized protein n=1 Tax=Patellaria atrata CBS 101060 TaxID=1346257 RepID=A0A9P4VVV2_9PEZI|nr:hypothetical protein M501DRAFT_381484 [Patellaria atrata CBS 101060]
MLWVCTSRKGESRVVCLGLAHLSIWIRGLLVLERILVCSMSLSCWRVGILKCTFAPSVSGSRQEIPRCVSRIQV